MLVRALLATALLAGTSAVASAQAEAPGYTPPGGFVPDSTTAVRIAEAILLPIYGEAVIARERPFGATLSDGVWTVLGSLPRAPAGYEAVGGVAVVKLARQDGRIIYVIHEK